MDVNASKNIIIKDVLNHTYFGNGSIEIKNNNAIKPDNNISKLADKPMKSKGLRLEKRQKLICKYFKPITYSWTLALNSNIILFARILKSLKQVKLEILYLFYRR